MSLNVEHNMRENNEIIISNILKMLERREIINSWEDEFKKINSSDFQNQFNFEFINKIGVYLINAKLTNIAQGHPLDIYLSNNLDIHKIVIVKDDVAKKVVKQIINDYNNAEFFFEKEMKIDLPSIIFVPKHEIIIDDERKEILNKFSENELARIKLSDPMVRYYNGKVGDIIKITRFSITAGKNTFYRKVIPSSVDNLFK